VDFIARDHVDAAIRVLDKIREAASTLQAMPKRGRIVSELEELGLRIYHEIISSPWRIIYKISDPNVFVMAVIDSRRNVEDILLERLIR
jgi:plasmid stabilization system protein ParE